MATPEDSTRDAAVAMLASGEATLSEVAQVAGVSRQLVRYWANKAGVDPSKARGAKIAKAWRAKLKRRRG